MEFLREPQRTFLKDGNYLQGQTCEERYQQIVDQVKYYEDKYGYPQGLSERIKVLLWDNVLSPSTPVLSNFGRPKPEGRTTKPLSCSCNVVSVVDSIDGIYSANHEVAMLSKLGAGVGVDFTQIRDKDTELSEGFYSNSKLDWIEALIDTSQKVSQNSVRRGYATPFISIEDAEYDDLMDRIDKNNPDKNDVLLDNTIGVKLPEGFMTKLDAGHKGSQERMSRLIKLRKNTGKVYVIFDENMCKNISPVYEKLGLKPLNTNICCVTGDQLVATKYGFKTVQELADSELELDLFDNESTHKSTKMLYRGDAPVFKVTLANGMDHTITSNHDLLVREGRKDVKVSIENGLSVGMKVCTQTNKGLFGDINEPELAFVLGMFLGDGTNDGKNGSRISIWENDFDLLEEIETICQNFYNRITTQKQPNNQLPKFSNAETGDSDVFRKNLHTSIFNTNSFEFKKGIIPQWIWGANEETHWQLIRGLLYSDGTVGDYSVGKSFGDPITLSLNSIDLNLLKNLQLICVNLGLNVKIYDFKEAGSQLLPKNDGTGEYAEYTTNKSYRLVLSNKNDLLKLEEKTKFLTRKQVFIEDREYRDNSKKSSEIISIVPLGVERVYCPTVDSDKHLWICNGFITSNTEIVTPHFDDKTFACIISSLNLVHWDRIKSNPQIIKDCIYFLDIIVQDYIDNSEGVRGLEKARKSAIEKRDIGLGTLGFHDLLQSKGFVFGDLQSKHLNNEIYSTIRKYSGEATKELAESLGSPKMCQDAGMVRRNVSLMKVAPNKSSSAICGMTSPGIEPFKSNYYVRKLAKIEHQFKNPHLESLLESKDRNTFKVWESIMENQGSVQHLEFLSEKEKDIFKTFSEISPKDIIDLAADRQEYIDMAQSLNLMSRPNYSLKDIYNIHKYAFEKGIKTLYYFYSSSHAVFDKDGDAWDVCSSCAD